MENIKFYIVKHSKEYNPQEKFLGYSQSEEEIGFNELKNLRNFFLEEGELELEPFDTEVVEQSNVNPLFFVKKVLYYVILVIKVEKAFLYQNLIPNIAEDKITFHICSENSEFNTEGIFLGFSNSIEEIERKELHRLDFFLEKNMEIFPSYFKNCLIKESDIFFGKHVDKELLKAELFVQLDKDFLFDNLESFCEV